MIVIGLTGSIGTGKSTTAAMFAAEGIATISADEIVHRLYSGKAAALIEAAFPETTAHGSVDREALSSAVLGDRDAIVRLEAIVHPMVEAEETAFLERQREAGADMAVIDIPLLFETGAEKRVDRIVVTSCAPDVQRARVLARPDMTAEKLKAILVRQVPDAQKRARADFVIETDHGLDAARHAVERIVKTLRRADETERED